MGALFFHVNGSPLTIHTTSNFDTNGLAKITLEDLTLIRTSMKKVGSRVGCLIVWFIFFQEQFHNIPL